MCCGCVIACGVMCCIIIVLPFLHRVNWVDIDGTIYKKPCALISKMGTYYLTYVKLLDIYITNSKVYFYIQEMKTECFDDNYYYYVLKLTTEKHLIAHSSLFS